MKKILIKLCTSLLILSCLSGCSTSKKCVFQVMSDIHFASNKYYSYQGAYLEANEYSGTGKQMKYLDDILDCYIDQIKNSDAKYLLISGDLTYLGAKVSHQELAKKLAEIEESGISVYVIPGNHDITGTTCICPDGEPIAAEVTTPEDFKEIYADFGYKGEYSYAPDSLSYVVKTSDGVRFFMLDSNLAYGTTYGKIKPETLIWLQQQLEACKKAKDTPIIVAHHNLFVHHQNFTLGYQIGNYGEIVDLMNKYNATLYLSGHLHPQSIVESESQCDIASGAFCVWPHNYGAVTIENGNWQYNANPLDVESWAIKNNSTNIDLLEYSNYGYNFFYRNAYNQSSERIASLGLDEITSDKINDLAAQINVYYFAGRLDLIDKTYFDLFTENAQDTSWYNYLTRNMNDSRAQNHIEYNKETGFKR